MRVADDNQPRLAFVSFVLFVVVTPSNAGSPKIKSKSKSKIKSRSKSKRMSRSTGPGR
jgi:hypothetical protein